MLCDASNSDACTSSLVYCDAGACEMKYDDTRQEWYCDGDCDIPTYSPTEMPTPGPTYNPSANPTYLPSINPTYNPSYFPTFIPTPPSSSPTFSPSTAPSIAPTFSPSVAPTSSPSTSPTSTPSDSPSSAPSDAPTFVPTDIPSDSPSIAPTSSPSQPPTIAPSFTPSQPPTRVPSNNPSTFPSDSPSIAPTRVPSDSPTAIPSDAPTIAPTRVPSDTPSNAPSNTPSQPPTRVPSDIPSATPSNSPSQPPTRVPSENPSISPSNAPSRAPSIAPTDSPTDAPTASPTPSPTSVTESKVIKIYYEQDKDEINDLLQLSLVTYAYDLKRAVELAIHELSNDSTLDTVCNGTDARGVECELSNYNPFEPNDNYRIDNDDRRRRMLNDDYSYSYNDDNQTGWWQGRIIDLKFCTIFGLVIDPQACDQTEIDEVVAKDELIADEEEEFLAYGTFTAVASTHAENYYQYLEDKFGNNGSAQHILDVMNRHVSQRNNTQLAGFNAYSISIGEVSLSGDKQSTDNYADIAFTATLGLYSFIAFCAFIALLGRFHACGVGADNVRVMGKLSLFFFFAVFVTTQARCVFCVLCTCCFRYRLFWCLDMGFCQ